MHSRGQDKQTVIPILEDLQSKMANEVSETIHLGMAWALLLKSEITLWPPHRHLCFHTQCIPTQTHHTQAKSVNKELVAGKNFSYIQFQNLCNYYTNDNVALFYQLTCRSLEEQGSRKDKNKYTQLIIDRSTEKSTGRGTNIINKL